MSNNYQIYPLAIGSMANIIHVVADPISRQAAVFDPAWDADFISGFLQDKNLKLDKIIMTHSHYDHINALDDLLAEHPVPVYITDEEYQFYGQTINGRKSVTHHDIIPLGDLAIEAIFTPGHTPGSTCYRIGQDLISGDTLFVYGCGICSLPGGDARQMFHSLNLLKQELASDTVIHPGHGYSDPPVSTWQQELIGNPFLHFTDEEQFANFRLNLHDNIRPTPYGPVTKKELEGLLS